MIGIPSSAIRHIQFITRGIWPINLLTLLPRGHVWNWNSTPDGVIGLWEWGAFVSLSIAVLTELGVRMFFALAERRRRIEPARQEGLEEGRNQARKEVRREAGDMLLVLNAAARENPGLLPKPLQQYQDQYQNGSANG
jgi:hypothetical protein